MSTPSLSSPTPQTQSNSTCASPGWQWYNCPNNSFTGCCPTNPCETNSCPAEINASKNITETAYDSLSLLNTSESNVALVAGVVSGVVLAVLIAIFLFFFIYGRKKRDDRHNPRSLGDLFDSEQPAEEKQFNVDRSTPDSSLLYHNTFGVFDGFDGRYSTTPEHLERKSDEIVVPDVEKIIEPPLNAHPAYRSSDSPTLPHPGSPVSIPHMPSPSPVRRPVQLAENFYDERPVSRHNRRPFGLSFSRKDAYENPNLRESEPRQSSSPLRNPAWKSSINTFSVRRSRSKAKKASTGSSRPEMSIEVKPLAPNDSFYHSTFYEELSPTTFS